MIMQTVYYLQIMAAISGTFGDDVNLYNAGYQIRQQRQYKIPAALWKQPVNDGQLKL